MIRWLAISAAIAAVGLGLVVERRRPTLTRAEVRRRRLRAM